MKIVALSDLHGYLPDPETIPEASDIVCICGDIVPLEYQNSDVKSISWFCLDFIPWVDKLSCKKVVFIAGNHDFFLDHIMYGQKNEDDTRKMRSASEVLKHLLPGNNKGKHKLIYLRDNSVEIDGKQIYGTPWVSGLPRWAFNKTEEELNDIFSKIPKKCDILLSHTPPTIGDVGTVLESGYNYGSNYGSKALADAMLERDIHYTFCGHVHSGLHMLSEYNTINSSDRKHYITNVSVKDERYRVQTHYFKIYEI